MLELNRFENYRIQLNKSKVKKCNFYFFKNKNKYFFELYYEYNKLL